MLTIHHPFPLLKAGISGIMALATGFYGTVTLLHVINHGDNKTAVNQSRTANTSTDTRAAANTSADTSTGPQQKDTALGPVSATGAKYTLNNLDDNDAAVLSQPQPTAAVGSGTSGATSVQVQPAPSTLSGAVPTPTPVAAPTPTSPDQSPIGSVLPTVQSTVSTTTQSILP